MNDEQCECAFSKFTADCPVHGDGIKQEVERQRAIASADYCEHRFECRDCGAVLEDIPKVPRTAESPPVCARCCSTDVNFEPVCPKCDVAPTDTIITEVDPLGIANDHIEALEKKCEAYREALDKGRDMITQLKDQGCMLPGEVDDFEDALERVLNQYEGSRK